SILGGGNKLPAILVNWLGKVTFVARVVTLVLITVLLFPRFSDDVVNHSRSECLSAAQPSSTMRNLGLLLENWWRTADTAPLQSNIYLYAVGDLDERDAARHAVVFAIKSHGPVETAGGCSFAIARESEFLRLGNASNGE